MIKFLGFKII